MKKRINAFLCLLAMGLCAHGFAQDTLFLRGGQVLIGQLKGLALGKVEFDDDVVRLVSIKTTNIKTMKAASHLFQLETIYFHLHYTILNPASDGKVLISINNKWEEMAIEEIAQLIPLKGKRGGLWSGSGTAGYTFTRSSDIGRFNADAEIRYVTSKFGVLTKGSLITTKTDSTSNIENASLNMFGSYLITPKWEGLLLLSYQHNQEQGLARRFQEGLAGGYSFISSRYWRARVISGFVLSQERSIEGEETPTQVELPVIFPVDFFHFKNPDMTISMIQSLYTSITQSGRFRQEGQLNIYWKIFHDFSISVQLYDYFDNQPPGVNAAKIDYGIVFGLNYKFSQ